MVSVKLTDGELKTVRCALKAYRDVKAKDAKLKKNAKKNDQYARLLVIIDDAIELFDGDIKSVYVNR